MSYLLAEFPLAELASTIHSLALNKRCLRGVGVLRFSSTTASSLGVEYTLSGLTRFVSLRIKLLTVPIIWSWLVLFIFPFSLRQYFVLLIDLNIRS